MLRKLGYDDGMYSTKSRVFVMSFQSDSPLKVKIHDSLDGDMHKRAWNLYANWYIKNKDIRTDFYQTSNYLFFGIRHPMCYGCSYVLANNSDSYLKVTLDLTVCPDSYYAPIDGESIVTVPPHGISYLGSTISDPEAEEVHYGREFEVEEIEKSDIDEEDEDEGSQEDSADDQEAENDDSGELDSDE